MGSAAKKKERAERIRKQKHIDSLNNLYPKVVFANEQLVNQDLKEAIEKTLNLIQFSNYLIAKSPQNVHYVDFLKNLRKYGIHDAMDQLKKLSNKNVNYIEGNLYINNLELNIETNVCSSRFLHSLILFIGSYIHEKIGMDMKKKYLPFEWFRIMFSNNQINIIFYKLHRHKTENGGIFTVHNKKLINHENKQYEIAFSTHALERFIERHFDDNIFDSFLKQDNFYECLQFSVAKINSSIKNQMLVDIYVPIISTQMNTNVFARIIETIKEKDPELYKQKMADPKTKIFVKIFSSPAKIYGDKIVLLTNLLPGYRGTSEYDAYEKNKIFSKKDYKRIKGFFLYGNPNMSCDRYYKVLCLFYKAGLESFIFVCLEDLYNKFYSPYITHVDDVI